MEITKINRRLEHNPIAIIGMASLFPKAINLQQYWENIIKKVDCITDVPPSHWNLDYYYHPDPKAPEKTYSKRGGFIPDVEFDPMEFGLPPNILEVTDVSQLLSLVVAKEALADAGYGEEIEFNRETTGVVLGVAQSSQLFMPLAARLEYPVWEKVLKSSGLSNEDTQKIVQKIKSAYVQWDENAFPGMLSNIVAGRIANRFNLNGMNCTVDAACASSFGALKMAVSELVEHRCDMMLTGGVDLNNSILAYICFSKTPALSLSGKIKPFDAESDGMILGEGIGIVVLKRLEDAERDKDKIYAVIKGIGTSSDGRYKSIYAPQKEGQVRALKRAYEDAGFTPESVSLIEAHGTGTLAGDRTEFASLKQFFGERNSRWQHIALGSVKSQIGHTKAAAGAASLIKTALALHHKILPPTINITQPNSRLNLEDSRFYFNTETRPWIRAECEPPRRAGMSSFGFGGTNYHVVLEEYTGELSSIYRLHQTPDTVLLFAATPEQLLNQCQEILTRLQSDTNDRHYLELVDSCKSIKIPLTAARVGFVVNSRTETYKFLEITIDWLKNKPVLTSWEHPQGIYYRSSGIDLAGKVVALFSGQGSQYLGMGQKLVMNFPELQRLYGYMDSLLCQDNLQSVSEIVFPPTMFAEAEKNAQAAALQRTEYAQPAIGAFSAGLYKILQQAGFKSDFVAGHSFGELTALWAAGVLSEDDYCFLVKARGQAMAASQDPNYDAGTMLAVNENITKVEAVIQHFPQVKVANFNSPHQIVLAGKSAQITKVQQILHNQGITVVLLPVSAAFHTPLIQFARKSFAQACKNVAFNSPKIPVYTNITGDLYPRQPEAIRKNLENHLSNPVRFQQQIENLYQAGGYCFVEFGPKRVMTNLVKDILGDRPYLAVALNPSSHKDSDHSLREAVVQLRVFGLTLKHIDPYQKPYELPSIEQNQRLKVRLNGTNYVSEKTKMVFEKALQKGHQVRLNQSKSEQIAVIDSTPTPSLAITPAELETNRHHSQDNGYNGNSLMEVSATKEQPQTQSILIPRLLAKNSKMSTTPNKTVNYQQVLESIEYFLTQFQQHQSDNLQLHQQYLKHQQEYIKTFFHLMQQQNSLFTDCKSLQEATQLAPTAIDSLERSIMHFHHHHSETLRIHEQYLQHQEEYSKNLFNSLQQDYSKLLVDAQTHQSIEFSQVMKPTTAESPASKLLEELKNKSADLVVETVSPTDKHEPTVTLEFSTVKTSVTTNGKLEEQNQELVAKNNSLSFPKNSAVLTDTKQQNNTEEAIPTSGKAQQASMSELLSVKPTVQESVTANTLSKNVDINTVELRTNLLAITSDKTGYPVEMLELDMDMESDLGIDSIKRVEIMGAMQELYPDLPQPNLEELAEKQTIGQIVDYLKSLTNSPILIESTHADIVEKTNNSAVSPSVATEITKADPSLVQETMATSTEIDSAAAKAPKVPVYIDLTKLDQNFLKITSDKTGYPVEMLELDMDMESDLGIDSIKRVEIMGAMQELYPDLPQPNLEELAEKQTIGQIVEYIQQLAISEKKKFTNQSDNQQLYIDHNIVRSPVQLKILPRPDFLEFSLPEGYISLLTDDGSSTTTKLAQSLIERGWKVVVLSFPQSLIREKSSLPTGVNRVLLIDLSEEHLQQQLNAVATTFGAISVFIHINPVFPVSHNGSIRYLEAEKTIIKHVFLMAKHLKKSLNEAAHYGRSCFCTVTRLDGAFGLEQKINFNTVNAGLFGLTKSLKWEWPQVFCRAIDLNPAINAQQSAHYILAELYDPNFYITEVAYGSQGRVTLISTVDSKYNFEF